MKHVLKLFFLLLLVTSTPTIIYAGSILVPGVGGGYFIPVTSLKEASFKGIIRQEHDFSCGSAAIATLLSFHYEQVADEQDVFHAMFENGDQEKIKKLGFSMLDMKKYLEEKEYKADGYRISIEKFIKLSVPAITLLNTNGYKHFVVVKGMDERNVLVGDPALGLRVISRSEFEDQWNGIFFMIRNNASIAKFHYNKAGEWGVLATAPYDTGVDRAGLSGFTLALPVRGDF